MTRFCRLCPAPHYCKGYCSRHYQRIRNWGTPHAQTFADRFWSRVDRADGCWTWLGNVAMNGYGRLSRYNRLVYAHRVAWELAVGRIPDEMTVDHLCMNRACVNPDHLEIVTRAENSRRGNLSRRSA